MNNSDSNSTSIDKTIRSLAIFCLAASLAYLSYAILAVVKNIPAILDGLEKTSLAIQPVVEQTEHISELIPRVLEEVALVREQIPPILTEVEAVRQSVPPILTEWQETRVETLPLVLNESAALREHIPAVLHESESYRALVPEVLAESENIRETLPVALDRVEGIVIQAETIASSAGENAVSGFFSGIFKAPFQLMQGVGKSIFPKNVGLSPEDYKLIENKAAAMLAHASVNEEQTFYSADKSLRVDMVIEHETRKEQRLCRQLLIRGSKNQQKTSEKQLTACRMDDGEWTIE